MAVEREDLVTWGRANGWGDLIEDDKRLPTGLRAAYDARNNGSGAFPTDSGTETGEGFIDPSTGLFEPGAEPTEEIAPVIRKESIGGKLKAGAARVRRSGPPKQRRTKVRKPRVPVDKAIGLIWTGAARAVALIGPTMLPVSRVLVMQAPVAGMLLEDSIKNTAVDRVLQPLARVQSGGDLAIAMVGPPLITAAIANKPQTYPALRPFLRYSLMAWIRIAGPKLEQLVGEDNEFEEKYGTTVDTMIDRIFAPEPEGPEENVH